MNRILWLLIALCAFFPFLAEAQKLQAGEGNAVMACMGTLVDSNFAKDADDHVRYYESATHLTVGKSITLANGSTHKIARGETLWGICVKQVRQAKVATPEPMQSASPFFKLESRLHNEPLPNQVATFDPHKQAPLTLAPAPTFKTYIDNPRHPQSGKPHLFGLLALGLACFAGFLLYRDWHEARQRKREKTAAETEAEEPATPAQPRICAPFAMPVGTRGRAVFEAHRASPAGLPLARLCEFTGTHIEVQVAHQRTMRLPYEETIENADGEIVFIGSCALPNGRPLHNLELLIYNPRNGTIRTEPTKLAERLLPLGQLHTLRPITPEIIIPDPTATLVVA